MLRKRKKRVAAEESKLGEKSASLGGLDLSSRKVLLRREGTAEDGKGEKPDLRQESKRWIGETTVGSMKEILSHHQNSECKKKTESLGLGFSEDKVEPRRCY